MKKEYKIITIEAYSKRTGEAYKSTTVKAEALEGGHSSKGMGLFCLQRKSANETYNVFYQ